MQVEPTYNYVKGRGWIVQCNPDHIVTMKCGTVVRLEFREPVKGEYYDFFGYDHLDFFCEDAPYPNWDGWKAHLTKYRLRTMCLHDGTDECDMAKWGYVVMVPV